MEILAISDIYGDDYKLLNQLSNQLEGRDRLSLIGGDIGFCKTWTDNAKKYQRQAIKILKKVHSFSKYVFYVPGDTDLKDLNIKDKKIVNVDKSQKILNEKIKVGILGLGGAPKHSLQMPKFHHFTWNEKEEIVRRDLRKKLRINLEKIQQNNPDFIFLLSHSPPYGVADKSSPIFFQELLNREKLSEISLSEDKFQTSRHLGSRILSRFIRDYEIDFHFFGHIHKRGGLVNKKANTKVFNLSHFSVDPHKLYGRKFLKMELTKEGVDWKFQHVVERGLDFKTYLRRYL